MQQLVRETKYASDYNVSQGFIFNQITQDEENARGKIAKINWSFAKCSSGNSSRKCKVHLYGNLCVEGGEVGWKKMHWKENFTENSLKGLKTV